jgi:GntR family transcriptional regulator
MVAYGDLVSIDYEGETPLWRQLSELLRAQIESGELPAGRPVPSEATLVQRYELSRGTVRKALDALVKNGLIRRVQGRGTFVA